ncbi:MAG TPA: GGDEF domain-containing protein [Thermoleophilaceae bacterium]|nr:GGDEF domain-containing protein [Thermoleophilaceae bacterium]
MTDANESDELADPLEVLASQAADVPNPAQETVHRAVTSLERTREALHRDQAARRRDLNALARDRAAQARGRAAERRELALPAQHADRRLKRALAALRAASAVDRTVAAADRERAAADRAQAAADRRQARIDLGRAHLDELTGVYTRGLGQEILRHEIDRAHRVGEPFTLAFLDVDGLKALNDREGHAAGDAFLRAAADAIRLNLRSYDPVVRVGGDEFVCGFAGTDADAAAARVAEIQGALAESTGRAATFSAGIAELEPGDTLEDLAARGDAQLYRAKRKVHS